MKTARGETSLEVWVTCPHCNQYQDQTERLKESLNYELRAEEIKVVLTCDDCKEKFEVNRIIF